MTAIILSAVAVAVLTGIDQALKAWASAVLAPVGTLPLIPGLVQLRFVLNDGMAFSMLSGKQSFLILVTGAALLAVAYMVFIKCPFSRLGHAALVLILAGGIGNLIDRVLNAVVVDYIDLQFMNFAVFNFADICVSIGVALLILDTFLDSQRERKQKDGTA